MRRAAALLCLFLLCGCGKEDDAWLGYAEGDNAFVAAPQAGWVAHMRVRRGDAVKVGDILFALDDTSQTSARDQAVATIAMTEGQMREAEANLVLTQKELVRQSGLLRANRPTRAPFVANPIARRLPMPRPAPVISTGTVLKECTPSR